MLYEYPQYVIYNEYAHMNRIRYFFRIHLKGITRIYRLFRRIMRNAFYVRLMGVGKLKKADTFFFVIDPRFNHPGLADRMKAIIACYNEAKKNGLHFKIVFKQPFVLEDYLHPTSIDNDWVADFRDLEYSFFKTRFVDEKRGWHCRQRLGVNIIAIIIRAILFLRYLRIRDINGMNSTMSCLHPTRKLYGPSMTRGCLPKAIAPYTCDL